MESFFLPKEIAKSFSNDGILINSASPGFYFDLFYLLAFIAVTILLIFEGHKRKLPWVSWLLVLAFSRLLFIVGTKIMTYQVSDWLMVINYWELVPENGKVILGGLALGLVGFLIGLRLFKLPYGLVDTFALALPLGIAIQRIGCFILGCCFGTPTQMPWAVRYSVGTMAHFHHHTSNSIGIGSTQSLSIHPFQLYESLNGVLVLAILLLLRKKIKNFGSLFFLSVCLLTFSRFFLEFFRDSFAHAIGGEMVFGIKIMQCLLLLTSVICLVLFLKNEKRALFAQKPVLNPSQFAVLALLMATVTLTWMLRNWLQPVELIAMNLMLFPAIAMAGVHIFSQQINSYSRLLRLASLLLPVILMSQTWVESEKKDSVNVRKYHAIQTGYGSGHFFSQTKLQTSATNDFGCGPSYITTDYENKFKVGAAGYSQIVIDKDSRLEKGVNFSFGNYSERELSTTEFEDRRLWAFNPYIKYDKKWYGVGGGLWIGSNHWADIADNSSLSGGVRTSSKSSPVYPQLYLRLGKENTIFLDGGLGNTFPSPFPGARYDIGIGSGFGLPQGNKFRVGRTNIGTFLQGQIQLTDNFQGMVNYQWMDQFLPYNRTNQFFLGTQYRFRKKE